MSKSCHVVMYLTVIAMLASVALISVVPAGAQDPAGPAVIQLAVPVGATVQFHFTAPASLSEDAWIGIVPSNVPHGSEAINDEKQVGWEYLSGRTSGIATFTVPSEPGSYDIRINDTDSEGQEIAYVTFMAFEPEGKQGKVWLDKEVFALQDSIVVHFEAHPSFIEGGWVGLFPADTPHRNPNAANGEYLDFKYISDATGSTLTFDGPNIPGSFDFRLLDDENQEAASVSFSVVE